jgi:hypothetical protein
MSATSKAFPAGVSDPKITTNRVFRQPLSVRGLWIRGMSILIYSWRRASMGSSRAAFRAGKKPNTTPTAAEKRNAI